MFESRTSALIWLALILSSQAVVSDLTHEVGEPPSKIESGAVTELGTSTSTAALNSLQRNETAENPTSSNGFESTIAGQLHRVLVKEFDENETANGISSEGAGSSFDSAVRNGGGTLETVARINKVRNVDAETESREQEQVALLGGQSNLSMQAQLLPVNGQANKFIVASSSGQDYLMHQIRDVSLGINRVIRLGKANFEDVERLIDSADNEFVISNPKRGTMELQQDVRLISDIVILLSSAAFGSTICCLLGQPLITGYLLAGSAVGPGGFGLIVELVQVETLAQFGVIFLLFGLGLEFTPSKLKHVRRVAVLGGLIQIALLIFLCGVASDVTGAGIKEGIFVGALLSMSSTAITGKCIIETGALNTLQGQIIIGTLILQDCCIGILFAMIPILAGSDSFWNGIFILFATSFKMMAFLCCCCALSQTLVLKIFQFACKQDLELLQTISIAFCLIVAVCSDRLGLSYEFGAFSAGLMITASPYAEKAVQNLEQIRNIFAALFMVSIGLIMNPRFLWTHIDILLFSLLMVVVLKAGLVGIVVRSFGYSGAVSAEVGLSLAQVGEFAFILLSRASTTGLIEKKLYLLLLGTTALSLVATPLVVRCIPQLLRLGRCCNLFKLESEDCET